MQFLKIIKYLMSNFILYVILVYYTNVIFNKFDMYFPINPIGMISTSSLGFPGYLIYLILTLKYLR